LLPDENTAVLPSAFLSNNLAKTALQTGQPSSDIVNAGGTGLGLSIARSIAVAHSGRLSLPSILEQDTTATLTLPLAYGTLPDGRGAFVQRY
jgi:light-regulated signal transduction histidine kinase (bacteriophytochrome)